MLSGFLYDVTACLDVMAFFHFNFKKDIMHVVLAQLASVFSRLLTKIQILNTVSKHFYTPFQFLHIALWKSSRRRS